MKPRHMKPEKQKDAARQAVTYVRTMASPCDGVHPPVQLCAARGTGRTSDLRRDHSRLNAHPMVAPAKGSREWCKLWSGVTSAVLSSSS